MRRVSWRKLYISKSSFNGGFFKDCVKLLIRKLFSGAFKAFSELSRSFLAEVKAECKMSLTRRLISAPCFENFPLNDLSSFLATFIIQNQQNHLICRFEKGNGESKKIFWIKVAATEIGFELTFFIPNFFFNPIIEVLLHSDTSSNLRRGAFREFWQNNLIRVFSCELTFS